MYYFADDPPRFCCQYCVKRTSSDDEIILHMTSKHPEEDYQASVLTLDEESGIVGYRTKIFDFKSKYL